ncbi:hypothetical protein TorRG33x02_204300 [Trema orientale]|uniref:Uncharacterized protein n=1 Tax=Trema orientale TaxID=63057 RepID=A0A2P5EE07_TREOI|nr:hypothetical protein TorRG33x02_204300 [Trema orientale]
MEEDNEGGRSRGGGGSQYKATEIGIEEEEEDSEEVELNLGLSLGGRKQCVKEEQAHPIFFNRQNYALMRDQNDDEMMVFLPPALYPALMWTSLLPTESKVSNLISRIMERTLH